MQKENKESQESQESHEKKRQSDIATRKNYCSTKTDKTVDLVTERWEEKLVFILDEKYKKKYKLNKERHKVDKKDTSLEGEEQKNTQGGMEGCSFWRQKRNK